MNNNTILYIPLDERPCNYIYPEYLAKIAQVTLKTAPKEILGQKKVPADTEKVWNWLMENAKDASHLVLSMDMLIYGGIVPSRLHHISKEACVERINRIREIKKIYPKIKIYAFQLITRAPARNGSGEEPDYYEYYGYDIYRYGVIRDKDFLGVMTPEEEQERKDILRRVPGTYLQDFLERREINFNSNATALELVEDKALDYFVIPMDDCKEFGYAPSERKQLGKILSNKGLLSKVAMHPGADEMGCTLTARAISDLYGIKPKIYVAYSSEKGKTTIPTYEDRSICETIEYHLLTAGADIVDMPKAADIALMVNPPTQFSLRLEKELITEDILLDSERNLSSFIHRMKHYIADGLDCSIADCAIPNGSDRALMQFLYEQDMLEDIVGYAGWNTSSNTIGTVVGHAVAALCAKKASDNIDKAKAASREFRFFRYLEDWGYQSLIRRRVTDNLAVIDKDLCFLDLKDKEIQVRKVVLEKLKEFQQQYLKEYKYDFEVCLPWNRMFEVEINVNRGVLDCKK